MTSKEANKLLTKLHKANAGRVWVGSQKRYYGLRLFSSGEGDKLALMLVDDGTDSGFTYTFKDLMEGYVENGILYMQFQPNHIGGKPTPFVFYSMTEVRA